MTEQNSISLYLQQQQRDAYDNLLDIQKHEDGQLHPRRYLATQLEQAATTF